MFSKSLDLSIIELGPGVSDLTLDIASFIFSKGGKIEYYPIDINQNFLEISNHVMQNFVRNVYPIHSEFENCFELIPPFAYNQNHIVSIGLTFMNFEASYIIGILKKIAQNSGKVLISTKIVSNDKSSTDDITKGYADNEQAIKFAFSPLEILGIDRYSVNPIVRYRNSRIEMCFQINKEIKINSDIILKQGDEIITGISYRYNLENLKNILNKEFQSVELFIDYDSHLVLALCS
jgi:uncharacterized SAM-dependent methyltransferase